MSKMEPIAPSLNGWLNDPNGSCEFRGLYQLFIKTPPSGLEDELGATASKTSAGLISIALTRYCRGPRRRTCGSSIDPRRRPDGGDLMRVFYIGNVIDIYRRKKAGSQRDYGHQRRWYYFSGENFLRNIDYPQNCTLHVRIPNEAA